MSHVDCHFYPPDPNFSPVKFIWSRDEGMIKGWDLGEWVMRKHCWSMSFVLGVPEYSYHCWQRPAVEQQAHVSQGQAGGGWWNTSVPSQEVPCVSMGRERLAKCGGWPSVLAWCCMSAACPGVRFCPRGLGWGSPGPLACLSDSRSLSGGEQSYCGHLKIEEILKGGRGRAGDKYSISVFLPSTLFHSISFLIRWIFVLPTSTTSN